jgi:tetratricopeptide (TPR) repeat protein
VTRSLWTPCRPVAVVLVLAARLLTSAAVQADEDPREVTGRAHFAQGEYQRALDIFTTLSAEKDDPIYIRNIGRCYQMLRQPERAIDAFREYKRRASDLQPAERREIDGFIREMEQLRQSQNQPTPRPATRVNLQPRPDALGGAVGEKLPLADTTGPRIYQRWWFWTAVGVAAAAAVTGIALGARSETTVGNCMEMPQCVRVKY